MRRTLVAGNWKLNKTVPESVALAEAIAEGLGQMLSQACEVVVAPAYTALHAVAQVAKHSNFAVAAQEVFYEAHGAFTGAVSAPLVRDVGCSYALVGHSERRTLFGETLASSQRRVAAALAAGLSPILCVGETLAERDANRTNDVVTEQLEAGLAAYTHGGTLDALVVAYEPVWAIGTGRVATSAEAQGVHAALRRCIARHEAGAAQTVRIIYGGSVKADNAADLLAQPDIDGALVGGASLQAQSFLAIVRAAVGGNGPAGGVR